MQGVILAAGMGKRLLPYTEKKSKSMVEVLGKPIIDYILESLAKRKVTELIIVIGYCKKTIIDHVGDNYKGIKVTYVHNADFKKTNNIYSLKLAIEKIRESFILCEGDIVFEPKMLDAIDQFPEKNLIFVGKYQPYMDGTAISYNKSTKNINELITGDNQGVSFDYTDKYKTINVYYFTYEFLQEQFIPTLELYLTNNDMSGYYEKILGAILYMNNQDLSAYDVQTLRWYEIDDANDLEMAEYIFSENKLDLIKNLHGGYWRYNFIDFCYLFNCYFPPQVFYSKLSSDLPSLINNYPSGHERIKIKLSRWYKEDSFHYDNLIVGNGASEFIRIISKNIIDKVTIPIPTFIEYENKLKNEQINHYILEDFNNFKLIKEDFVKSVINSGSNVAIIINPNNPSGCANTKGDIIWILEKLNKIILIVDESFIDFTGDRDKYSVQHLINNYQNLVILRSISKEFGVPGLRLGYLLTVNENIKHIMSEYLPIWNINSIAEYFIDHFPHYYKYYEESIEKVLKEKEWMFQKLKGINYLSVLPSHANYFLCKVNGSAEIIMNRLFDEHNILVKNCSNKKPFENTNYIRLSVRTRQDNEILIKALESISSEE